MKFKVGDIFYHCLVDESDGTVEFWEYHVTLLRGKFVYAVVKLKGITWGKRSTKAGDFGWLMPHPPWTRIKWSREQTDHFTCLRFDRHGLHKTKLKCIRDELKDLDPRNFDSEEVYEKAKRTLQSLETREKNKCAKPSNSSRRTTAS